MRIAAPPLDEAFCEAQLCDLQALAAQPDDREQRPCPGCDLACPDCGSRGCTCKCRPDCPAAPRRLSSEPERFPIEPGILPLVYALSCLRLLPPCWSCEGHVDASGGLRRLPGVWFISRKVIYPTLVADLLGRLKAGGEIAHGWQVAMLNCGLETESVFVIEPRLQADEGFHLGRLRNDVAAISVRLGEGVKTLARKRIERLNENLGKRS
jgi:hypothetical protein